jgi:mannose-6-phosphate isomerase-like protein (cupin superfamily)
MADGMRYVFKVADVPLIQSPDGTMRDSVMITEDTCGSDQYTAGLFWVRPGTHGHSDVHPAQDEVYYIISGRGVLHLEGVEHRMAAGDVVFVPKGHEHSVSNDGDEVLSLFWAIGAGWSTLPEIRDELATWPEISPDNNW